MVGFGLGSGLLRCRDHRSMALSPLSSYGHRIGAGASSENRASSSQGDDRYTEGEDRQPDESA